jgi:hypothetical protein
MRRRKRIGKGDWTKRSTACVKGADGRLGFEKHEIGRRMQEICAARGVPHDIAMDNASRIYGDAWFEFLGSSRTMLGSESGSNAFDFDGHLEEAINAFAAQQGGPPTYPEFKDTLDPLEAPFDVGQISPRIFECAAMMTPMILFRGRYSHAIEADVHYIPLEKDFSNVEGILARLGDLEYLQGFADRAYRQLVASGAYGYRSLARLLEDTIEQQYPLWIDPKWVTYRSRVADPWTSLDHLAERRTEEDGRLAALAERPTAVPLGLSEFNERQARVPCGTTVTQRAWRLVPTAHRHRLIRLVQRLVSDRDHGRPLPSGLSLVWRLLPRRIRRRVVSTFL